MENASGFWPNRSKRIGCTRGCLGGVGMLLGFLLMLAFVWTGKHCLGLNQTILWILAILIFFGGGMCMRHVLMAVLYRPKCPQCSRRGLEFVDEEPQQVYSQEKLRCRYCGFEERTGTSFGP